jgi:hypothetical protein
MAADTTHAKQSLGLNKMLGEKKVELKGRERDLVLREAALAEAHTRGLNPRDNHDELMEFVELQRLLQDSEADCVIEVEWLVTLVRDVSKVLEDLGMPPILGIPQDPRTTSTVLEVVDVILEHPQEANASGHDPWD